MEKPKNKSVIERTFNATIRRESTDKKFREDNEIQAAYNQVGQPPNRNTKSWYRDIYEFYQNNEV